ncbi:NAD-dependent epimerase/dehydratase family protein [Eggerthella timonensis]|uniref:NAD-dependent epimerase/dehydratase family protein n=1 Tax=Eggerthella timonensis TaxID=1871008 RepID=UPI000C757474|nr:NAD-dependent epimerase/dehydratase family protein [Eggerthella timonensis]
MKRILITGATSWIGSEVEAHLATFPGRYVVERVSLRGDAWRERSWEGFDSVLHLAAVVHEGEKAGDMGGLYDEVNVALTSSAALKAKVEGVPHFVFLSSFSVYGAEEGGVEEVGLATEPRPATFYGKSKLAAERALEPLAGDGFAISVVRAPLVYGTGCEKGNFPRLAKLARVVPVFPDVDNVRSMLYSRSLAELVRLLAEDGRGGLFLPQDADHVNTSELVRLLAEAQGRRVHLSRALGAIAAPLASASPTLGKLFGDARYALEASECGYGYRVATLEEAVRASVGGDSR